MECWTEGLEPRKLRWCPERNWESNQATVVVGFLNTLGAGIDLRLRKNIGAGHDLPAPKDHLLWDLIFGRYH